MHAFWSDLRSAVRALHRGRLATALAVLSLALVIGGNATLFGVLNALLFRPLPFDAPERLALVDERERAKAHLETLRASATNFLDWRERSQAFDDMAGFLPGRLSLGSGETPEPVKAARVTAGFFDVLGVRPRLGRAFEDAEARPGGAPVVLLSDAFARRRFAGEAVLGRELVLGDEAHTVIGVLPAGFEFLMPGIDVWVPLRLDPALAGTREMPRDRRDMVVVGRLRDGVGMEEARSDLQAVAARLAEEHPEANRGFVVGALNLRYEYPDPRTRQLFAVLQGMLVFVLLIACANVSNLLLARGEERRGEIALRAVLGAGRGRILRQLLTEGLLLAGLGGTAGLLLATLGIDGAARSLAHLLPAYWTPRLDGRVVTFTLALTAFAGVLFGLLPSTRSGTDLAAGLRESGRNSPPRRLLSRGLVVAEIALALVLLCGAATLSRTFLGFRALDPGFSADPQALLNVELSVPSGYGETALRQRLEEVRESLAALPGVRHAAVVSHPPQSPFVVTDAVTLDGRPPDPDAAVPHVLWVAASPQYPETIGAAIRRGRFFTAADRVDTEAVAVVNASMAQRWWPGVSPVGERLTLLGKSRRIVGVAGDVRQSLTDLQQVSPVVYLPAAQQPLYEVTLILACASDPLATVAEPVRRTIARLDPRLMVGTIETQYGFVEQFFAGVHLMNGVLGSFGVLAIFLAAVGTYGVLAHAVARRTREIGVRIALGARPAQVTGMVTRQSAGLALVGLALGAPGAVAIDRLVAGILPDMVRAAPLLVAGFAAVLLAVTLAAGYFPARRAASVDPVQALRSE